MRLIPITVDNKKFDITLEFLLNFFTKTTATKSEIIELLHLYNFICMELRLIEMVDDTKNEKVLHLNQYQKEYCKNQKKISQENIKKIKKEFTNKFSDIYFRDKINDTLDKILKEVNEKKMVNPDDDKR
jgi:hypothetical protein